MDELTALASHLRNYLDAYLEAPTANGYCVLRNKLAEYYSVSAARQEEAYAREQERLREELGIRAGERERQGRITMRAFSVTYYGERLEEKPEYGSDSATIIRYTGEDTVFYDDSCSCVAVKRSLIEHDGYPVQIHVKRIPKSRHD